MYIDGAQVALFNTNTLEYRRRLIRTWEVTPGTYTIQLLAQGMNNTEPAGRTTTPTRWPSMATPTNTAVPPIATATATLLPDASRVISSTYDELQRLVGAGVCMGNDG